MQNQPNLMPTTNDVSTSELQQYIIAIGASAGGLQEINSFFDHTPLDGVSYVIIQHLSADYKSVMSSLLARHSKLEVCEAEDNMKVEKNKVYVIPSKNYMTINDGRLILTDKHKTGTPHLTINTFFNSLALDVGDKAIGVILSGTGSDGSKGVETIKKEGGMILTSDPATSEYSEMPANAIETGLVDFVLLPEQMPKAIEDYVKRRGHPREDEHEDSIRIAIVDFIRGHLPHDFTDYKQATILRRIKRRAAYHNINSLENYLNFLKTNPDEIKALAQDFLISVTAFFRDKEAFDFLQTDVIPDIIAHKTDNDEIKIWVAGCATGEEAYSLAMLMTEGLNKVNKKTVVKIFATDLDDIALAYAKNGVYDDSVVKNISKERLELFFTKESRGYKVKQAIRKMLIFAHHDLVKNPPYCNMDLISCRNLLIYLNQTLQKRIFSLLQFGLKKDGYLFLGPSETFPEKSLYIEEVNKKFKIYKITEARRNISFDVFSTPVLSDIKAKIPALPKQYELKNKKEGLREYLNETLLSELDYTGVCVDENNYVVQTFGDLSKYLLPKMFNFILTDIVSKPLAIAFKNASYEAKRINKKVVVKDIKFKHNDSIVVLNLTVIPFKIKRTDEKLMMVLFNEVDAPAATVKDAAIFDEKVYANEYVKNLEEELRETKENLQDVFEKLDASNENMQSFNEELLSNNEEMQSTNEELQSVNEELHTINAEYQTKIKELSDLNDDLNNYFRSNENGQLFINSKMLLMKFSPGAVKHINLLDTDIGRPISNISSNIKNETLEKDAKEVIANGKVITKEVEAINGKWYQMMTMPYVREKDHKIDGAIITFNDITELKKVQTELDRTNKTLTTINADLDNFVYSASHDLLGPLTNIEHIISILEEEKDNLTEEVKHYHHLLRSAISKFKIIIRDLAVVGKIQSEIAAADPVNLVELINEIKLSILEKITSANASISANIKVEEIRFSKKNLRSILYNLISNAIKFKSSQRDPEISITTSREEDFIVLSVRDNGLGIPREELGNVFNMYKRIHHNIEGQGIGLYLIKKIVDASGGKVVVESEAGKGSNFKIYFKEIN
jgi:two-component system CheB/CheR fusion protein